MTPGEQRRMWAWALVSRCPEPPPVYGSPEWLALPDGREKVAAVVLAAEWCAMRWGADKQHEDQTWAAERASHRAAWTGSGFRPDPAIAADVEREWREWAGGVA